MMGVYLYTNKLNGMKYVGQSTNIERRFRSHLQGKQYIDNAIKFYGIGNFTFQVLEECDEKNLLECEKKWILKENSMYPNGYNMILDSTNWIGENNWSSKLTNDDIILMRSIYNAKKYKSLEEIQKMFPQIQSKSGIFNAFTGRSWSHIMPEVFTEENKQYYDSIVDKNRLCNNQDGVNNPANLVKSEDAIKMRVLYEHYDRNFIFSIFPQYSERTITSIISGQNWKSLPIYKKRKKEWIYPPDMSKQELEKFLKTKEQINEELRCK